MIYRNSNFPILATKRIVVSNSDPDNAKIKVEFLIKSRESESVSRWFSSTFSDYSQYLNIYFMALDDTSAALVSGLALPEVRYSTLRSISSLEALGVNYNRDAASITFSEVLQNEAFTSTPVSDMSGDYYHDIYSELEINVGNIDFDNTDRVHLIGFIHMDAERYYRDKGIVYDPRSPDPIESRGGELIYDLLLERNETGLEVPLFREVFYLEENTSEGTTLEPYYGPAHYHSEENPGPAEYVGWMVGPQGMDMGPQLETRRVRNYKVTSDIYSLQSGDSMSFNSLTGLPSSPTGNALDTYINSVIDISVLQDSVLRLKETVSASEFAASIHMNNFIKLADVPMSYVQAVVSQDDASAPTSEESHHGVLVGIDYFRLVRSRSSYGDILNFHNNKGNLEAVAEMLYESKIINLEITRERVSNRPHHFSAANALVYVEYDTDEAEKTLVRTRGGNSRPSGNVLYPLKNTIFPASSQLATISEIELVAHERLPDGTVIRPSLGFVRHFCVKDYDLYHNIQTGKYRHNLDFIVRDGVSVFIRSLAQLLRTSYNTFSEYYTIAQQPVIRTEQGIYESGNHDYRVNDFHSTFRESNYAATIIVAIRAYQKAVLFLTGEQIPQERIENIRSSIDPRNTNLSVLGNFHSVLYTLMASVEDVLAQTGESRSYDDVKKQKNTHVPSSGPGAKSRTIDMKVKGIEIISAITEGSILANYSNFSSGPEGSQDNTPSTPNLSLVDYAARAARFPDRILQGTILPSSYLSFAPSPFSIDDLDVQPNTSSPKLGTPSEKKKKPINTSTPSVISSFSDFRKYSKNKANNHNLKINMMRSKDSVSSGFINKDEAAFAFDSFFNAGITLGPVSSLSSTGVGPGMKLRNPSSIKDKLKDIFTEAKDNNCLELSDELKATLQAAALNGITREELSSIASDNYSDLNEIRAILGPTYSAMINLAGSLQTIASKIAGNSFRPPSERDKFLDDVESNIDNNYGLSPVIPYEEERSSFVLVSPGVDSYPITVDEMTELQSGLGDIERFVFLKIQPNKKEDGIISVNDGYLLRV